MAHTDKTTVVMKQNGNWECCECGAEFTSGNEVTAHFDQMRGREEAGMLADMAGMISDAIETARDEGAGQMWGAWAEECREQANRWREAATTSTTPRFGHAAIEKAAADLDDLVDRMRGLE